MDRKIVSIFPGIKMPKMQNFQKKVLINHLLFQLSLSVPIVFNSSIKIPDESSKVVHLESTESPFQKQPSVKILTFQKFEFCFFYLDFSFFSFFFLCSYRFVQLLWSETNAANLHCFFWEWKINFELWLCFVIAQYLQK